MLYFFHTALDNTESEIWPHEMDIRPVVGDVVISARDWNGKNLVLEVVACETKYVYGQWVMNVELHMCKWMREAKWSINDFQAWYNSLKGGCNVLL